MKPKFTLFLPLIIFPALYLFTAGSTYSWLHFPLDDAWIFRVYSKALLLSGNFQYSGSPEAGVTSPLWAAITAPAELIGYWGGVAAVVLGVKLIGILCALWFTSGCLRLSICLLSAKSQLSFSDYMGLIACALILSFDGSLLFSSLSGMESLLTSAMWIEAIICVLERRPKLATTLAAFLPLARPEAVIVSIAIFFALYPSLAANKNRLLTGLLFLTPSLVWACWCLVVTGHPLPNSFYFKSETQPISLATLRTFADVLQIHGIGRIGFIIPQIPILIVAPFITLRAIGEEKLRAIALGLAVLAPLAYLLAVILSRPLVLQGYYWTRWCDPALHVLSGICAASIPLLLRSAKQPDRSNPWHLGAALTILVLALGLPRLGESFYERAQRMDSDSYSIFHNNEQAAVWLRERTTPEAVVATVDAGAVRYLSERKVIDIAGLNEHRILFGLLDRTAALATSDYLAIFPNFLDGSPWQTQSIELVRFSLSESEYSICPCPDQREFAVYKLSKDSHSN
ncbi:MAG: hypothetical protein K1X79_06495 [Oligoflexia bacterium]|nr:hypothetical protein [Oligoflexia bacterium]